MERKPLNIGGLRVAVPVIQGGMGVGVSLSRLAGAVASCGGVGVISTAQIGYRRPDFEKNPLEANLKAVAEEIKKARTLANGGVLGVNIMVATKHYAEYVKAAVEAGIDLIISGAGLPVDLPGIVGSAGTKLAPIVSTVKSASVILRLWKRKYRRMPDLVVIEGPRAGGHLGFSMEQLSVFTPERYEEEILGILRLVKTEADAAGKEIPVVVAGGIYDCRDMDHALLLGADGVQMGTRFVTTYECDASMAYKQTYLDAREADIEIVKSPVGLPGRAIHNRFLETVKDNHGVTGRCYQCLEHCDRGSIPYCISKALINAVEGRTEEGLLFCGSNAWRASRLEHVADIFRELQFGSAES